jgi:PleD family two-component response regulator
MLIFDRIRLQDMDRRNWQLWILAIVMILILAGGLALHMYTLASVTGFSVSPRAMLKGTIGFCVLAILFVGYLIDRQVVIARLRKELDSEKIRNRERRARGNKDLLRTLFGPGQFCDRLALELQRAVNSKQPLSGLTVSLEGSPDLWDNEEIYSAFGDAVKAMMGKLRGEDSIYQFTSGVFGLLLPGTAAEVARGVALRVADGLNEAMGASHRYSFDIRITNFPDQAKTVPEMEKLMRAPLAR